MNATASTDFDVRIAQGMAAMQADDAGLALQMFQGAVALRPDSALPHFLLGSQQAALGQLEQAQASFAAAVGLAPDFAVARYQLGLLQFSCGRASLALLTWQPLLSQPQSEPMFHFVQGFAALAQNQFDDALGHFEDGLKLSPQDDPMSGDIRKIVSGIQAPMARVLAGGGAEPPDEGHVLLSAYEAQGRSR